MKWLNVNVPLGVSETPIGFSRKSAGAGAALGAVGDMLYGIWNTYETNDSNERIAKNTNEANERINESQLAWAREQYELEKEENRFLVNQAYGRELENREYNSPSNEMQRLRAAGLNPYLAKYGNGAVGGFGSISAQVGQNSHANQPSAIPMQTGAPAIPNTHGLGLSRVGELYLAAQRQEADISAMRTRLDIDTLDTVSKVHQRDFQNGRIKAEMGRILDDIRFNRETWDERARAIKVANDKIFADQQYQESLNFYQKLVNKYAPANQEKILRNLDANYDEIMSRVDANDADAAYKLALSSLTGVDEQIKRDMADAIVDDAYNKAEESYWNSERSARRYLLGDKIGDSTPAMDLDGHSYSSPRKQFDLHRPRHWSNVHHVLSNKYK